MNQAITSIFALSSQCNAAVFALRSTLFNARGEPGPTILLPLSIVQQVTVGRHISDIGILDLMALPETWAGCATDPQELFSPRTALRALYSHVRACTTLYVTEYEFFAPIIYSLHHDFIPEQACPFTTSRTVDATDLLEGGATRDCEHGALARQLADLRVPPQHNVVEA